MIDPREITEDLVLDDKAVLDRMLSGLSKSSSKALVGPSIRLNPYQSDFVTAADNGYEEVLYSGSMGGGKSLSLCTALMRYVAVPNTRTMLLRKNLSDLKRSTLVTLLQPRTQPNGELEPPLLPYQCIQSWNRNDGIIRLHNNSEIVALCASDPEKVKSIEVTAAFIDECAELEEDQYLAVQQRIRRPSTLPNCVFACTNPSHKGHHLYKRFVLDKHRHRKMITVSAYSNHYLPKSYIRRLEELPPQQRRRNLMGEWVGVDSAVFPDFDRTKYVAPYKHLIGDKNTVIEYIIAQDYGGGRGGSGMVLLGRTNTKILVLDEFFMQGPSHTTVLQWMERYRQLTYSKVVYDSANAALATDMANAGWKCIKCIKDIEGSLSLLQTKLHNNEIGIDSGCVNLIRQIEEAERSQKTGEVMKQSDWDVLDAFRYGVYTLNDCAAKPVRYVGF